MLEIEQIVKKTLEKIELISKCGGADVDTLVDVIMPKVKQHLKSYDMLHEDVTSIRSNVEAYMQHIETVDHDIADIFLDLHNIYRKLERFDDCGKLCPTKKEVLKKRVKESEDLLTRSRHYLTNDPKELISELNDPPMEPPTDQKVRDCLLKTATITKTKKSKGEVTQETQENYGTSHYNVVMHRDERRAFDSQFKTPSASKTKKCKGKATPEEASDSTTYKKMLLLQAEKRAFLANMLMPQKSEFSLNLNRFKAFFGEAQRMLDPIKYNGYSVPQYNGCFDYGPSKNYNVK